MGVQLKNNVNSLIVGSLSASATSVVVTTGSGANFPSLGAGDYFYATIIASTGVFEIVKCTTRVNDVLTVTRAQEGTLAIPFPDGSRIDLRVTAQSVLDAISDGVALKDQASEISIADAGGYYTGTNVEAALQELRAVSLNTFTGDGTTVAYTITATYGLENLTSVHINGVYQHKATYSLSGTTLTFSQAPPLNTIIEVLVR
jgi:hypothetical protein